MFRRYLQFFGLFFYAASGIFILIFFEELMRSDLYSICLSSSILILLSLAYLHFTRERKIWSVSGIYLVVFSLFHCGLVMVIGFNLKISPEFTIYLRKWIYSGDTKTAIVLVMLAICFYQLGVTLACFIRKKPQRMGEDIDCGAIPVVGFLLVTVSFACWSLMIFFQGGLQLFGGSYAEYLDATPGGLKGWLYFFIGIGLIFLAISPPGGWRKTGLAVFVLFSILAMALGLRGEVLFPVFTALAVYGMKRYPLGLGKAVLLGIALLSIIAVVRQMRQVGFLEYQFTLASFVPADGIAEMGGSIRPVVAVVSWIRNGDELMSGRSYWAPFDRVLVYFVPGWERPPIAEDDRLLGRLIGRRTGAVGFSSVAEAYYNFGTWGVVTSMLFIGFLLGRLDQWPVSPVHQMVVGIILFPLMIHIRNTFLFVPSTLGVGFLIIYLTVLAGRLAPTTKTRRLEAS